MFNDDLSRVLANEITAYINSRKDKKEEEFLKSKPKKNKKGEIKNGAINDRLLVVVKKISQDSNAIADLVKSKKRKEQTSLNFHQMKYQQLINLIPKDVIDEQLTQLKKQYHEFVTTNNNEHNPVVWLNNWVMKAKDISFATHVGKLTHSSSKSSSIFDSSTERNDSYLTTNSLVNLDIDTASSNAASLPIADILNMTSDGVSVLDCLKQGDNSFFTHLVDDSVVISYWCEQLKQAYDSTQKQSYFLSKQIYFPICNEQYHLLMPLTSSSLVHAIHLEHKKYWDEDQVKAKSQKKNKKFSKTIVSTYPNKAYLHVTGSNHSNASSLNGQRGGRVALLSAMPPVWKSNTPSYVNKISIFDKSLAFELINEIKELKNYLLLIKNKSLSISEPKRNEAVINKLQAISSQFFYYLDMINLNESLEGWTANSKLPNDQQLVLEPWREDEAAKVLKLNNKWQVSLAQTYGRWLNNQLDKKSKLQLSPIQARLWSDCFLIELRERVAIQEVKV